mgnify:CR=1 FL=1
MKQRQLNLKELNSDFMEKIAIIGAGGFGREVKTLIDDINKINPVYEIIGFFDDGIENGTLVNGLPVLGTIASINNIDYSLKLALGIGVPAIKEKAIRSIVNNQVVFPILIHPSAIISKDFITLNLSCTVGHDTVIEDFSSFMPAVNISGEVLIEKNVYVGTGAKIINQLSIGDNTVVGAGAVVSKTLPPNCTAVGIPAKPIKFHS